MKLLPRPNEQETRDLYLARCLSDGRWREEFPNETERLFKASDVWTDERGVSEFEHRPVALEVCELRVEGETQPKIEGLAAVFERWSVDLGGFKEIVRRGAFKKTLESGDDIRAMVDHDTGKVIGRRKNNTLSLRTTREGLRVTIKPANTGAGRDIVESVRRGDVDGMSIGFSVPDGGATWSFPEGELAEREVTEIDLSEVSVVAFPAFADTSAAVRSIQTAQELHEAGRADLAARSERVAERQRALESA